MTKAARIVQRRIDTMALRERRGGREERGGGKKGERERKERGKEVYLARGNIVCVT